LALIHPGASKPDSPAHEPSLHLAKLLHARRVEVSLVSQELGQGLIDPNLLGVLELALVGQSLDAKLVLPLLAGDIKIALILHLLQQLAIESLELRNALASPRVDVHTVTLSIRPDIGDTLMALVGE
jgi:hypothetical protein